MQRVYCQTDDQCSMYRYSIQLCTCYILWMFLMIGTIAYNNYRLPTSVRPERYKLRVLTHLEDPTNFIFTGDVQIQLRVLEKTKNITLHVQDLDINETKIRVEQLNCSSEKVITIKRTEVFKEYDFYIIHLNGNLQPGLPYLLTMSFAGELSQKLRGYYVSSYRDNVTGEKRYIAVTQFEPASARSAFPCFDEPDHKATFVIALGHNIKHRALSNMPFEDSIPIYEQKNWQWSVFQESVPMSTYLVAYAVHDFVSMYSRKNALEHVKFRTWARPDAIQQCCYAANVGPKLLMYYEKIFGIKFPLAKIDQIALPDFSAGAMENWGLITYRETALLFDKEQSSLSDMQRISAVVAHELAHQWFGNLVTMKWWTDLWLNEGFATYIGTLGVEHLNAKWHTYYLESLENTQIIFNMDAMCSSHPVRRTIKHPSEITETFDSISYRKGSAIIRMMHLFMGDTSFCAGLSEYLKKHTYKNAEQDDLWVALSEAAHANRAIPDEFSIGTIMNSWTLQTGYPLVTVKRDYARGTVRLSQSQFLLDVDAECDGANRCWYVPLSYTTERAADFTATVPKCWLNCTTNGNSTELVLPINAVADEWIIFNIQLAGLYKVNYDERNWQLIIKMLNSDDFRRVHIINRAQLIDDAMDLAWSGHCDYKVALDLLEYLKQERVYMPWKSALENLASINRIMRQTSNYATFLNYMRYLLLPIYKHLHGLNDTQNDGQKIIVQCPNAVLHKELIASWACRIDLDDCVARAREYFRQWRESKKPDGQNSIPKDLRVVIYCNAIRYGSVDDWHFLWMRYKNSNVAGEKRVIIAALGCTREIWLLHRYLARAFFSKGHIRQQDAAYVFAAVARGDIGYLLARDFLLNNMNCLADFYKPHTEDLSRLLLSLTVQMNTAQDLEMFKVSVEKHAKALTKANQGVKRALETVQMNVHWRKRNLVEFTRLLRERFRD